MTIPRASRSTRPARPKRRSSRRRSEEILQRTVSRCAKGADLLTVTLCARQFVRGHHHSILAFRFLRVPRLWSCGKEINSEAGDKGDWTEVKIFAATAVLYRAALKAFIAKDLAGTPLDYVDQNARQRAQRRFMRALVEMLLGDLRTSRRVKTASPGLLGPGCVPGSTKEPTERVLRGRPPQ